MDIISIINNKKQNKQLTKAEIYFAISGYVNGQIKDYQMSALLMAILLNDMDDVETAHLTQSFIDSGIVVDLSSIDGIKVDKHSTGGVGDKVTLILIPLAAAMGLKVAKMSGRGLGHTGGTIDKLETFSGFNTEMTKEKFMETINNIGMAVMGQSEMITPADKKIYALRDVTGTVDSIPLIASSIMAKKIATGSDAICLDVKFGKGAFLKKIETAKKLATTMIGIGKKLNKDVKALLTHMDIPLGYAVGNAVEIYEAIEVLNGKGPNDVIEITIALVSQMAVQAKIYTNIEEASKAAKIALNNGSALNKFKEWISGQGGSLELVDYPEKLLAAPSVKIKAEMSGFINDIDALMIGELALNLGAGRVTKEDKIDLFAGVVLTKTVGDKVNEGETLAILYSQSEITNEYKNIVNKAHIISKRKSVQQKIVYKII